MLSNCVPIRVTRLKNCVYIVAPTHVESIVFLSHESPDSMINVKVEFGKDEGKMPLDAIVEQEKSTNPSLRLHIK